jgi:hypothetical protein
MLLHVLLTRGLHLGGLLAVIAWISSAVASPETVPTRHPDETSVDWVVVSAFRIMGPGVDWSAVTASHSSSRPRR